MGETNKQVRVDNWGIFFLQRLQLFFNRTDYCDLTLQFEGNVQLKVHRLVMNACTEYFNILEQTCEVVDGNTIIMPDDLQADVILPIVNFMYTGMLEFQMSIFDKLYRTADIMNIPILTKLLDAQKKPISPLPRSQTKKVQPTWNLHGKKITPKVQNDLPATLPGRKLPVWKRKTVPAAPPVVTPTPYYSEPKKVHQDPLALFDNAPKPTRFEWPEDEINSTFNLMENSFDDISYTSKPLLTQDDELRASTSFDDIKYSPSTNRKVKDYNPTIDMEEVKSYVKEQKIRSDLTEYEDEDDPDSYLETVNIERDNHKRKAVKPASPVHTKKVRFSVNEKENKEAKINITATGKTHEMDHTKIISEVLKKYPHLVKKNKNIRLKILAKSPTKIDSKILKTSTSKLKVQVSSPKATPRLTKVSDINKTQDDGPWVCTKCSSSDEQVEFVLYYLYRKHMTDVHHEKFDSKMCKFCGHQSNKHNMLLYHQFTRHGIKPPPAYNFPKCNRCPYIALTENLLIKHKLNHTKFDLQCLECKVAFNNQASLFSHVQITGHSGKSGRHNYDCQYCTKRYHSGSNLFSHIKLIHRDEARRDGIVSIDEKDELDEDQLDEEDIEECSVSNEEDKKEKITILADIKVPVTSGESTSQTVQQSPSTTVAGNRERVSTTASGIENVSGGIATSLGLVDIVVLDENQQYILHNDQQLVAQQTLENEQQEYIIPEITEQTFSQTQNINEVITSEHNVITQSILNNSDIASTDELVMVLTDHDYNDGNNEILSSENSNIVVLYSHPVDGQQNQFITSQGNLMLNSQTGMLEIRNSDQHGLDNSQDAQIESIEMIQREINSHVITTPHSETVTVPTTTSFEDTLAQDTVILENQFSSSTELIETKQDEEEATVETSAEDIDVNKMISINDKETEEDVQEVVNDEVLILNDCLSNQEEEPMEIDEECSIQENQTESQNVIVQETPNSIEDTASMEQHEEEADKNMPDINDTTEPITPEQEPSSEKMDIDTVYHDDESQHENVEKSVDDSESNKEDTDIKEGDVPTTDAAKESDFDPEGIPNDMLETESKIQCDDAEVHVQEVKNINSEEGDNPKIEALSPEVKELQEEVELGDQAEDTQKLEQNEINEEGKEIATVDVVETIQEPNEIEIQEPQSIVEENLEITEGAEQTIATEPGEESVEVINEEEKVVEAEDTAQSENAEGNEEIEHLEELVENVEEMVESDEVSKEEITDQQEEDVVKEDDKETIQIDKNISDEAEETEEQSQIEAPSQVEDSESQMEDSQLKETGSYMEINLQTEEVCSQIDETPSQIDDNSVQNESADETYKDDKFHEDISQTDDKINFEEPTTEEGASSDNENSQSQDSQTSQCSSRQEELIREYKKTTSQATKISILNDWEDTEDSQQSDNVSKKAELTVNKLIHDWDDDDEEGHESDS